MFYKSIVASSLLLNVTLFANDNYVNILAKNVISENNITTASDKVVIFSPQYYMSANKAIHDQNKETLELFGDVNIVQNSKTHTMGDYAFIDMRNETLFQEPIYSMNLEDSLWMVSKNLKSDQNETNFECPTTLSSCDSDDPFWHIKFSSGYQDKKHQWVHTFNTRVYLGSLPIFYTPYFGFPTDKTRRSGLLRPTLGYSNKDGFLYAQPIYLAPAHNYDIEFTPQLRGIRGKGIYANFRLADSLYSRLEFKSGYFSEQDDYALEHKLKNTDHYGWDLDYKRTKLFSTNHSSDGLFASFHYLSDIDYKNLEKVNETKDYEKNIESKLNYFYDTNRFYSGVYARYYLDTSKESNEETIQQLPVVHLHSYTTPFFFDKFLYSSDFKFENYTRQKGLGAKVYSLNLPIGYSFGLFDDFLTLSLKESLQGVGVNYAVADGNNPYENGSLIQSTHYISLSSELLKPYSSILHTVGFDLTYAIPGAKELSGDLYGINGLNKTDANLKPFEQTLNTNKELSFSINQSFFNKQTLAQLLNHKIKQSVVFDNEGNSKKQNLENEMTLYYSLGSISNRFVYNHYDKRIIEYSSNFNATKEDVFLKLDHYGTNKTPLSNKADAEYLSIETGFGFKKFYSLAYKETYDLFNKFSNKQEYKFNINKKCWGFGLRFEDSVIASSSLDSYRQKIIYATLELKPLGGFEQNYTLNKK